MSGISVVVVDVVVAVDVVVVVAAVGVVGIVAGVGLQVCKSDTLRWEGSCLNLQPALGGA